ncbi:hypothetical protein ACTXT7_013872, partial [Hymenolepis weldensis]
MSLAVSGTFKITVSPNSSNSSTQSAVAPVSTKMLPTATQVQSAITDTAMNSLRQAFADQGVPKVIASRKLTQYSSTRFEYFCRGLISPFLRSPPNLNDLDDRVKRQLFILRGEGTVEEILNYLHFRYWTKNHVGVQIRAPHLKNF